MASGVFAVALQEESGGSALGAAVGFGFTLVMLAFALLLVASMWKVFSKAGEPGWASLVPIYSTIVWLKIAGKPAWWFILVLIPLVNLIVAIVASISLAERFGKGTGYGLGLVFLLPIFYPMLAFGDARYRP